MRARSQFEPSFSLADILLMTREFVEAGAIRPVRCGACLLGILVANNCIRKEVSWIGACFMHHNRGRDPGVACASVA